VNKTDIRRTRMHVVSLTLIEIRCLIPSLLGAYSLSAGTTTSVEFYLTHTFSLINHKYSNETCFSGSVITSVNPNDKYI
jgi:hypothetical protein